MQEQCTTDVPLGAQCQHRLVVKKRGTGRTFSYSSKKTVNKGAHYERKGMCPNFATKIVRGKLLCNAHFD